MSKPFDIIACENLSKPFDMICPGDEDNLLFLLLLVEPFRPNIFTSFVVKSKRQLIGMQYESTRCVFWPKFCYVFNYFELKGQFGL